MDLSSPAEDETYINFFFESVQLLRSSWTVLHERCRKLEASLHESKIAKEQLQAKLELSRDYARKVEKEKEDLATIVQELHKDLRENSLIKWIETLNQKISTLNNVSKPHVANETPLVIDDITIDSDDENDLSSNSLANTRGTLGNISEDSFSMILPTLNSTTTDVTNHDCQFASSTLLVNRVTTSTDSEVSVEDTLMSIENSPQRDLNDTQVIRDVEITDVNAPASQHSASTGSLVEDRGPARDDKISDVDTLSSKNLPFITPLAENNEPAAGIEATRRNEISDVDELLSQKLSITPLVENNQLISDIEARKHKIPDVDALSSQETTVAPVVELEHNKPETVIEALDDKILGENALPLQETAVAPLVKHDRPVAVIEPPDHKISSASVVSLVANNEPTPAVENSRVEAKLAPETNTSSQECTPNDQFDNEAVIPSTEKEQNIEAGHDISVDTQISSKSSIQLVSISQDEISLGNQIVIRSNVEASEITTIQSPENLIEKSVSVTNDCEISNQSQLSEINSNTSEPPHLISIVDIETAVNDDRNAESTCSSVTSPPTVIEYPSPCTPIVKNRTSVNNDIEMSNSNQHVAKNSQAPVQSVQSTSSDMCSEIANRNNFNVRIMFAPCRRLIFSSESLFQQGVNHEEIHPAEEAPFTNIHDTESSEEPKDNGSIDITNDENESMDSEKLNKKGATPEELMSQIFGSPMATPDRNSEVFCIPNQPSTAIDLNLSDEELFSDTQNSSGPVAKSELTVNLPHIFAPSIEVMEESVNNVISHLESETETSEKNQKEPPNAKRPCPSSSEFESNPKRSSPLKSAESGQDFVLNSDDKKLLKCLLCEDGKEFNLYSALDAHIIAIHPNPYPYYFRCHYGRGNCKRHFKTTKKVNDHVRRRHAGEDLSLPTEKLFPGQKPWHCSICDKIFAHSSHLIGHLRKTHNVTETEGINKYESKTHVRRIRRRTILKSKYSVTECVICLNEVGSTSKFKTYHDLDDHIARKHPNPYPFYLKCPFCRNGNARHFKGLSWLNNHINNNHASHASSRQLN